MLAPELSQSFLVPGLWAGLAMLATLSIILGTALVRNARAGAGLRARIEELEAALAPADAVAKLVEAEKRRLDETHAEAEALERRFGDLRSQYAQKKATFDRLSHETKALEDKLDLAELGLYEPKFQYDNSAQYEHALRDNRDKQKEAIADGKAVYCTTEWVVGDSRKAGETMTRRAIRMTLRAFNNECEVLVGKVSWKNFDRIAEQIQKSFSAINKLNESNKVFISDAFLALKLEELDLAHHERLRLKEEADELREERVRAREEAKAQREIESQIRKTEEEEARRKEALELARAELRDATDAERSALTAKIATLQAKLDEATAEHDRAISMAEQTRVGYVYVISNLGAFGEGVFKIGMTRRVDPDDRVDELGDASVPFGFDVHAMAFTHDAPKLERDLHQALDAYRLNRVNMRKEFFRVPVATLRQTLLSHIPEAAFKEDAEAQEYYLSLPKATKDEIVARSDLASGFPAEI